MAYFSPDRRTLSQPPSMLGRLSLDLKITSRRAQLAELEGQMIAACEAAALGACPGSRPTLDRKHWDRTTWNRYLAAAMRLESRYGPRMRRLRQEIDQLERLMKTTHRSVSWWPQPPALPDEISTGSSPPNGSQIPKSLHHPDSKAYKKPPCPHPTCRTVRHDHEDQQEILNQRPSAATPAGPKAVRNNTGGHRAADRQALILHIPPTAAHATAPTAMPMAVTRQAVAKAGHQGISGMKSGEQPAQRISSKRRDD